MDKRLNELLAMCVLAISVSSSGCSSDGTKSSPGVPGADGRDGVPGADGRDGVPRPGEQGYLLVAEQEQGHEAIHAYSLPDLSYTGTIRDVLLGNHLGTLVLADGRVIGSDDKHGRIIAIQMNDAGKPSVVSSVAADLGPLAVWGCADAALRHLAVSSGKEGLDQIATVVDLEDFSATPFPITMNLEEELHPFIAGEPAHLFLGVGGAIQAFPLAAVLAGSASAPVANVAINAGSHGPVVSHASGRVYISAKAGTGFDGVNFGVVPFARVALIPWDVDGRSTGQNFRPRLSWDEQYIYGAVPRSLPEGAENWASREVDFHAADIGDASAKRAVLTTGIVSKFQLSRPYAFFANTTADGDFGILVDVDSGSPSFQKVVARIRIDALVNGPMPGVSAAGTQRRGSAITPDGRWAFVSHGGEGKISVINTETRRVVKEIETPTALAGGGYLVAIQPGNTPVDTCMR